MVNDLLFDSNSSEETEELVCESETPSFPAKDLAMPSVDGLPRGVQTIQSESAILVFQANSLSDPDTEGYPRGTQVIQDDSASTIFSAITTELP